MKDPYNQMGKKFVVSEKEVRLAAEVWTDRTDGTTHMDAIYENTEDSGGFLCVQDEKLMGVSGNREGAEDWLRQFRELRDMLGQ